MDGRTDVRTGGRTFEAHAESVFSHQQTDLLCDAPSVSVYKSGAQYKYIHLYSPNKAAMYINEYLSSLFVTSPNLLARQVCIAAHIRSAA